MGRKVVDDLNFHGMTFLFPGVILLLVAFRALNENFRHVNQGKSSLPDFPVSDKMETAILQQRILRPMIRS